MALLPFSFLLPALSGSTLTFNWRAVVVVVAVNAGWTRVGLLWGANVAVVRTTVEEEGVKAAACCREHTTRRRSATIEEDGDFMVVVGIELLAVVGSIDVQDRIGNYVYGTKGYDTIVLYVDYHSNSIRSEHILTDSTSSSSDWSTKEKKWKIVLFWVCVVLNSKFSKPGQVRCHFFLFDPWSSRTFAF